MGEDGVRMVNVPSDQDLQIQPKKGFVFYRENREATV